MACTMYAVGSEHNTVLPPYARVRLREEKVNIPPIIDPNYCRITQWSAVCIDLALKLRNKCVLCSSLCKADMEDPRGWMNRRKDYHR